ncbi:hypothetical protein BU17DRAFT_8545, partial [Hysterangium stoloniferum]
ADIFSTYSTPPSRSIAHNGLNKAPVGAVIDETRLDRWARDTNGEPFTQETNDEPREYMNMTDKG